MIPESSPHPASISCYRRPKPLHTFYTWIRSFDRAQNIVYRGRSRCRLGKMVLPVVFRPSQEADEMKRPKNQLERACGYLYLLYIIGGPPMSEESWWDEAAGLCWPSAYLANQSNMIWSGHGPKAARRGELLYYVLIGLVESISPPCFALTGRHSGHSEAPEEAGRRPGPAFRGRWGVVYLVRSVMQVTIKLYAIVAIYINRP